jgi:hypothetical protein
MPNWVPSSNHIDDFKRAIGSLTTTAIAVVEQGFPLTVEEVEACTTPAKVRGLYDQIRQLGFTSVQSTNNITMVLDREHGASRAIGVRVFLPRQIYFSFEEQIQIHHDMEVRTVNKNRLPFDTGALPSERVAALIKWAEAAVYERRRCALTVTMVTSYIDRLGESISIAKMVARWPVLRAVCQAVQPAQYARKASTWGDRVRQLPENLKRWEWPVWGEEAEWRMTRRKRMMIAEEVLLAALTMTRPTSTAGTVRAEVCAWERLDGLEV